MSSRFASCLALTLALSAAACGGEGSAPPSSSIAGSGGSGGSAGAGGSAGSSGASQAGGTNAGGGPGFGGGPGVGGASTGGSAGSGGSAGAAGAGGSGGVMCMPDEDGDNIPDEIEGKSANRDSDGDGTPDYQDTDSDDDSIPDQIEGRTGLTGCNTPADSDTDGTPDYLDTDSDNNGISDTDEVYPGGGPYDDSTPPADTDGDGLYNYADRDNDGDDLRDEVELAAGGDSDTDGDGLQDFNDPDADDDGIADGFEGTTDFDSDGIPNFQDLDSDKDGISDSCEAGFGHMLEQRPADSDADGKFDAFDVDSDNDGLLDGIEDANNDCVVNVGETDRVKFDTDGDGASDLIEKELGSNPTRGSETPQSIGKYYFVMPYNEPPQPLEQDVVLGTSVSRGDIAFLIDSTGSMGASINNLKSNITSVIGAVKEESSEARFGVLGVQDYPYDNYGAGTNLPVYLPSIPEAYLTDDVTRTTDAINALTTDNGLDAPEAMATAIYKLFENPTLNWPGGAQGGTQPPFSPGSGYGALGFRDDGLPIVVAISDAPFHNGRQMVCSNSPFQACREGCCDTAATALHDTYNFSAPDMDDVVQVLADSGARFIGVTPTVGGTLRYSGAYPDMAYLTDQTKSLVFPSAFPGSTNKCPTDKSGVQIDPDGPPLVPGGIDTCRLIFGTSPDGAGAATTIQQAILALLNGIEVTVRLRAIPDTSAPNLLPVDAIDQFVDYIEVQLDKRIQDPAAPGKFCDYLLLDQVRDNYSDKYGITAGTDGYADTVLDITPAEYARVCFRIVPKPNTIVQQTDKIQKAVANLRVLGKTDTQDGELVLGSPRQILFIVPPLAQ